MEILPNQLSLNFGDESTSSPGVFLANRSQLQEKEKEQTILGISGRRCCELFEKSNLGTSWAKMFVGLLVGTGDWYSTRCVLTWKLKVMKSSRYYFQLQASMPRTKETEFGLLLTPTTREEVQDFDKFKARMEKYPNGTTMPNLATQVMGMLPTPTAHQQNTKFKQGGTCLQAKLQEILLPTPTAIQRDHPERVDALKKAGAKTMMSRINGEARPNSILDSLMFQNMLPTPTAEIIKHGHSEKYWDNRIGKRQMDIAMWNAQTNGKTSQLSPQFVMEMMGFPTDWTLLPFLNGETNQSRAVEMQ